LQLQLQLQLQRQLQWQWQWLEVNLSHRGSGLPGSDVARLDARRLGVVHAAGHHPGRDLPPWGAFGALRGRPLSLSRIRGWA
jgi:hypothetical protein